MRRAVLTVLAALGVAAGLAVTASSTSHEAYAAGMRGLALAAVVVVLEVTNTLGTLVWLTDPRAHAKWQAGALVGCSSLVTGYCGAQTYGPIGLVGPFFVLAGVHLANLAATTPPPPAQPPAQADPDAGVPAHRHAVTPDPPAQAPPAQADTPTEQPTEETPTPPTPPTPTVSAQADTPTRLGDEDIVAQLLARPETPGRDAICREFRCGKTKAERVLATLADRRRPHLVTTREETAR